MGETSQISGAIEILSALLTPTIALVTVYIAFAQWRIERAKFRFDRYDRRLKVYNDLRETIALVLQDSDISLGDLWKLRRHRFEVDFLFGPEIQKYLDEVHEACVNLWSANSQYRDLTQPTPEGYDHQKIVDQKHKAILWLAEQNEIAHRIFRKYLDIGGR